MALTRTNLAELVELWRSEGRDRFVAEWSVPVLIRRVDEAEHIDEVRTYHTRAAASVALAEEALRKSLAAASGDSSATGTQVGRHGDDDEDHDLRVDDVLPLRKRPGATTFLERIGIGRASNVDVPVPLPRVSKYHAFVTESDDNRLCVSDAKSTFGTFVAGEQLEPLAPRPLDNGEAILLGPYAFRFHTAEGFLKHVERLARIRS